MDSGLLLSLPGNRAVGNDIEICLICFPVFFLREKRSLSGGMKLPAGEFPGEFPFPFPVPDSNPSGMEFKGRSVDRYFHNFIFLLLGIGGQRSGQVGSRFPAAGIA